MDVGGEAEEQGVLHHFPKKRKSSESFEAYSGPAASQHYEENNIKGKRLLVYIENSLISWMSLISSLSFVRVPCI